MDWGYDNDPDDYDPDISLEDFPPGWWECSVCGFLVAPGIDECPNCNWERD